MRPERPGTARTLLGGGTWLAAAAVATSVGFAALRMVGGEVTDRASAPLSDQDVRQAADALGVPAGRSAAARPTPPAAPPATPTGGAGALGATGTGRGTATVQPSGEAVPNRTPATGPDARSRSFGTAGGVVAATCTGTRITLQYAYPADGYRSEIDPTAERIEVHFIGRTGEVNLTVRCANGVPVTGWGEDGGHDILIRDR